MKIFIDESGIFRRAENRSYSISCIGALVIPDCYYNKVIKKYLKLRGSLPKDKNGEVKGRMLNEQKVALVIELLRRNDALFEAVLIDMNMQDDSFIQEQKVFLRNNYTSRLSDKGKDKYKRIIKKLNSMLDAMSTQLFIQFSLTTTLVNRVLQHAPTYYSLRQPKELGAFEWYVDAKGKNGVIDAEKWWRLTVSPFLSTLSKNEEEGGIYIEYGDYSYYDNAFGVMIEDHPKIEGNKSTNGIDTCKVLSCFNFMPQYNPGLELVDILANSLRRALMGNLQESGWHSLPEIIIHRKDQPSIPMIIFSNGGDIRRHAPYQQIYDKLNPGKKSLLTQRASNLAKKELEGLQ